MAFAPAPTLRVLKMDFSAGVQGWSEKLWIPEGDLASSIATATTLVGYRLALLAADCVLDYAHISTVDHERDSHEIDFDTTLAAKYPGVAVGTPTPAVPPGELNTNDLENCIRVKMENARGDWANRYFHGIPDAFVLGRELTDVITPAAGVVPPLGDGTFSTNWFTVAGYYLAKIKSLCVMGRRKKINGVWASFSDTMYRIKSGGLGRHKVGRPSGVPRGRAIPH
jgi:hypothetical protein